MPRQNRPCLPPRTSICLQKKIAHSHWDVDCCRAFDPGNGSKERLVTHCGRLQQFPTAELARTSVSSELPASL